MTTSRQEIELQGEIELQAITTNIPLAGIPDRSQEPRKPSGTLLKLCFLGSAALHTVLLTLNFHHPDDVQSPQSKADFVAVELLTIEPSEEAAAEPINSRDSINSRDIEAEKAGADNTGQIVPPVSKNSRGAPSRSLAQPSQSHSASHSQSEDSLRSSVLMTPLNRDTPIPASQHSVSGEIGFGSGNSDASRTNSAGTGQAAQLTAIGSGPSTRFTRGTTLPSLGNGLAYGSAEPADNEHIVCISCPLPDYFGVEGSTRVIYDIAPNGSVTNLRLQESSGDPAIDQTVLAAVSIWRFTPSETGRRQVQRRLTFEQVGSAFQQRNQRRRQTEPVRLQIAPQSAAAAIRTTAPPTPAQQHATPSASITPTGIPANPTSRTEATPPPASVSSPPLTPTPPPVQPASPASISTRAADLAPPAASTSLSIGVETAP